MLDESVSGVHFLVTVTFSHDVIVQSIGTLENQESCSINSTQYSKAAKIVCTNLNYDTSYTLLFQGVVNFTDATIPLEFILGFITNTSGNEQITGKMGIINISKNDCHPFCVLAYQ